MKINKHILKRAGVGAILILVLLTAFYSGFRYGRGNNPLSKIGNRTIAYSADANNTSTTVMAGTPLDFNLYWEVWDTLKNDYVDKTKITDQNLFYGSLKGMAAAAGDPYTVFMDPKDAKEFSNDLAGTFEGIGAEVGMRNEVVTVIAPLDGMPAQKAGVRAGDKIYAIDGQTTVGMTVDAAVNKIRGSKGTKVTLTIIRGKDKPKDIVITRGVIVVKSVKTEMRSDGIYVIRVSNFNDDTDALFRQAVADVLAKNPKGIILDLRNNPGGYLESAVNLASEWVEAGPVVVEQFNNNKRNEYPANGRARLKNFPTVVLVNSGSASASEILAGALRDYKKATLVGETTFGKGSVQTLQDLSDGSALKVTIAKWLTPAGDFINEKGIKPNIEIKMTQVDLDKSLDPQFNKALELLKAKKK